MDAFYRGDMSFRRLWVLVSQLPPSSRVQRDGDWTQSEYFLAQQINLLQIANYQRSDGKGQKPKPLQSPKQQEAEKRKKQASKEKPLTLAQFDSLVSGS